MSENTKRDEDNVLSSDSISEITEEAYKYCTRCGFKNYLNAEVCFNCERCSDFVDTFEEYEKLKQSDIAATVQAMLEVERQKMEAEIRARVEQENAAKHVQTKEKKPPVEKVDKKTVDEWYNKGTAYFGAKNNEEAYIWYRKAAEHGHAEAQACLGSCYQNGWGVKQNYDEAAEWYMRSAEQGYVLAQYLIGNLYYQGNGVKQDYAEAAKWFKKMDEQGSTLARFELEELKKKGYA